MKRKKSKLVPVLVSKQTKAKAKRKVEEPLAKNGVVLRDFKVGNHTFKKGTKDSWSQVKLSNGTESLLSSIGVYLEHGYGSIEHTEKLEKDRQKEADRQLEQLAVKLEKEHEEETRKRLARVAAKKSALEQNLSR